jgi:hypothetical protein
MLKKISSIFIAVLLLITTTGLTIDRHYCGESLVSVTFGKSPDCCKSPGCCHHHLRHIKINDSFQASEFSNKIKVLSSSFPYLVPENTQWLNFSLVTLLSNVHSPPLINLVKDCFLQVFRN